MVVSWLVWIWFCRSCKADESGIVRAIDTAFNLDNSTRASTDAPRVSRVYRFVWLLFLSYFLIIAWLRDQEERLDCVVADKQVKESSGERCYAFPSAVRPLKELNPKTASPLLTETAVYSVCSRDACWLGWISYDFPQTLHARIVCYQVGHEEELSWVAPNSTPGIPGCDNGLIETLLLARVRT